MTMLIIYRNAMFNGVLKKVKLFIIHVDPLQTSTLLYQLKRNVKRNEEQPSSYFITVGSLKIQIFIQLFHDLVTPPCQVGHCQIRI